MGTVILNDEIIQSLKIDHSTLYLNLNWKGNAQKVSRKIYGIFKADDHK